MTYRPPPRRPGRARWFGVLFGVAMLGLVGIIAASQDKPGWNDCLASLDYELFGGYDVVDCDDPSAEYEVVNRITDGDESTVCDGHDGTDILSSHDKYHNLNWAVCLDRR